MKKTLLICALVLILLGGLHLIPFGGMGGEPLDSPLFAQSLSISKHNIANPKDPIRGLDDKGGVTPERPTCELTCAWTCTQPGCGITNSPTCVSTCEHTCSQVTCLTSCGSVTCDVTCLTTCAMTCTNTCEQLTCASTCVLSCGYTCSGEISLVSFSGQAESDRVILTWITASEIDNYYFLIRRATDPQGNFEIIAQVPGCSFSAETKYYTISDFDVVAGVTYYYSLADISLSGEEVIHPGIVSATPTAVAEFQLAQNFPNPFNQETRIRFNLPNAAQMKLSVFNIRGETVAILANAWTVEGSGEAIWDGTDLRGYPVPSGTYLYELNAGDFTAIGKMVLLR